VGNDPEGLSFCISLIKSDISYFEVAKIVIFYEVFKFKFIQYGSGPIENSEEEI
jgi:hypothetical protein